MFLRWKKNPRANFRRQFGTENRTEPLPIIHPAPSTAKVVASRIAILATILVWIVYLVSTIMRQLFDNEHNFNFVLQTYFYLLVVTLLTFSALMYLIARQGAFQRFIKHKRVPKAILDEYFSKNKPEITVIIPSYAEEPQVVRKTILSAALQEYPKKRVVLLIDDNPNQPDAIAQKKLDETRSLPDSISKLLCEPQKRFGTALKVFSEKNNSKSTVTAVKLNTLIDHYQWAISWLIEISAKENVDDHVDVFFVDQVLGGLIQDLRFTQKALESSKNDLEHLSIKQMEYLYNRLSNIFSVEMSVFERKKYVSLSHEANKAMNLNSYIGLMGGSFVSEKTPRGIMLTKATKKDKPDLVIPDSEFLLTLDADSILLQEYCLRLVYFLEQPGNSRVAVTQTPYSSFRGAPTRIERLAGATTDLQHIIHQGMSYYGATFWVGANAVLRKKALKDIEEIEWVGGFEIKRYIQDQTVIEDTESTIDLARSGWTLVSYPERLSYSATPSDFGSLVVQRRRWANGGLIILPKLFKQISEARRKGIPTPAAEAMLRLNYMASITWACFGLILLLVYPYDGRLLSPIIILSALPYFLAQASDLKYNGYKRSDIFWIYGFNLILLPVNLAGVLKSIQQALTGKKIPFARTPKIKDHTIAQPIYIISPLLIIGFSIYSAWIAYNNRIWWDMGFSLFNTFVTTWAFISYIGVIQAFKDLWHSYINWLFVKDENCSIKVTDSDVVGIDWWHALYYGYTRDFEARKDKNPTIERVDKNV